MIKMRVKTCKHSRKERVSGSGIAGMISWYVKGSCQNKHPYGGHYIILRGGTCEGCPKYEEEKT